MSKYLGTCPVCHKELTPQDDIVICPECGAPYHRACYRAAGQCVFSAQHRTGFEYRDPNAPVQQPVPDAPPPQNAAAQSAAPAADTGAQDTRTQQTPTGGSAASSPFSFGGSAPQPERQETADAPPRSAGSPPQSEGQICPKCGAANPPDGLFCTRCGTPLKPGAPMPGNGMGGRTPFGFPMGGMGSYTQMQYTGEFDGIDAKDWAAYIGNAAPQYIMRFAQQDRGGRSFTFSAFLLPFVYFAYRKVWKWAILSLVVLLLLQVPSALVLLQQAGISWTAGISVNLLGILSDVAFVLRLAFCALTGVLAVPIYRKRAGAHIRKIRDTVANAGNYTSELMRGGAPSVAAAVLFFVLYMSFYYVLSLLGGMQLANYLQSSLLGSSSSTAGGLFS